MATKTVYHPVNEAGHPAMPAGSAAGWMLHSKEDIQVEGFGEVIEGHKRFEWGPVFSEAQAGNSVDFFTTGAEYFARVAAAIGGAKKSVFVAGWQVNYDVELVEGKTLLDCLSAAVKAGARVYVMPWLSPKAGVDTGDFETMLAIYQLNAGQTTMKAFCLPAMQQGDQGALSMFFSHHQKLVVVDNDAAFVGGIDLAYGRRDDGNFSLKAEGRKLNELYNSCVPPVHTLSNKEQADCLTRAELLAAAATDGLPRQVSTYLASPADALAPLWDTTNQLKEKANATQDAATKWVNDMLYSEFVEHLKDVAVDSMQGATLWAWDSLNAEIKGKLEKLRDSGAANAANAGAALIGWLNNASLDKLPPEFITPVGDAIKALTFGIVSSLSQSAFNKKPYARLFEKVKITPKSGKVIDVEVQPRMPWHDVHSMIKGPAVYHLAMNFVRRWSATATEYEKSFASYRDPLAKFLLEVVDIKVPATPKSPRIAPSDLPQKTEVAAGSCWVQVLRSAPKTLLSQEVKAGFKQEAATEQNNCLKAVLKVIQGAKKFIYIEGQFFQSAYGADGEAAGDLSGPAGVLLKLQRLPGYQKYADMLGIRDVRLVDIPRRMRWAKVDDVLKDAQGRAFMSDLHTVMTNVTTVEALRMLGKPQERLMNPVSKALSNRIGQSIRDGVPVHVYIVLPVHPEGQLNLLNIMTQTHLTMQSLVFGKHSLVNCIRREILIMRWRKERKLSADEAKRQVAALKPKDLNDFVGDEWQRYLTLLNLRNWDTIGKQAVTEQIYVHSKLVIVDDRVAVLGSANINDRSMLGDRDSELAVIVTDDTPQAVSLNGKTPDNVGKTVHNLRRRLWQKLFGLDSQHRQATDLAGADILDSPASLATIKAIQGLAQRNAGAYEAAFWFMPSSGARPEVQAKDPADDTKGPPPASIWPTWHYQTYLNHNLGGALRYRMPFDELFWRIPGWQDATSSWNVGTDAADDKAPVDKSQLSRIKGFICALPINWTFRENNNSGMNLTVLAGINLHQSLGTFGQIETDASVTTSSEAST